MKPLQQLFGLALDKIYTFLGKTKEKNIYYIEMDRLNTVYDDVETFMKQKEKYCSAKIKEVLFQPFLNKIHNSQNGIQTIDNLFARLPMRPKK
jgi:hypothetical protein